MQKLSEHLHSLVSPNPKSYLRLRLVGEVGGLSRYIDM